MGKIPTKCPAARNCSSFSLSQTQKKRLVHLKKRKFVKRSKQEAQDRERKGRANKQKKLLETRQQRRSSAICANWIERTPNDSNFPHTYALKTKPFLCFQDFLLFRLDHRGVLHGEVRSGFAYSLHFKRDLLFSPSHLELNLQIEIYPETRARITLSFTLEEQYCIKN